MIRIEHNGMTYLCDTVDEAVRLGQSLQVALPRIEDKFAAEAIPPVARMWTPDLYRRFYERLSEPQRRVLDVFMDRGTVRADYLCERAGVPSSQALAGILSGMSRQAVSLGLSPRMVFEIDTTRRAAEGRVTVYSPDARMLEAAHASMKDQPASGGDSPPEGA